MPVLVVINRSSGGGSEELIRQLCLERLGADVRLHETDASANLADDVGNVVERSAHEGCDVVAAAGGDGTVALVADAIVSRGLADRMVLGIVPAGTANVLAAELGIPQSIEAAVDLLAGEHAVRTIDAMEVDGRHFVNQIGIGLDAAMIEGTDTETKQTFGRLAYIATLLSKLHDHRAHRFFIDIDGWSLRVKAGQVLLANVGTFGLQPFKWGPDIDVGDGTINLCAYDAESARGYLGLLVKVFLGRHKPDTTSGFFEVRNAVAIRTSVPLVIQADGEIIGTTPIKVRVVPHALRVVVPAPTESENAVA